MEKEQILSTLKEKVGQTSLSERSLSDYVENNLPADGAEPDEAYWTKHIAVIKSINGNYSADVAKAIAEQMAFKGDEYFAKNVEALKAYLKKNPDLLETQEPKQTEADDSKLKALEEKIEKLLKAQEEQGKQVVVSNLRSSAKNKATDLKVTRKALWEDAVDKVQHSEGDTEASFLEKVKVQYSKDVKRYFGDGEKPYEGQKNTGGGNEGNKVVNDYFAKKKAKMGKK